MTVLGDVYITISDNMGSIAQVPASSVQAVIGIDSAFPSSQSPIVTASGASGPQTLKQTFAGGPMLEAAALTLLAGGTVLCIAVPITTKGSAGAVTHTGTGGSAVTVTLDSNVGAFDDYLVELNVLTGGTVGTAGCVVEVSLDAGRNFGPPIQLGTANTYVISGSGITLHFGAGTLVAADTYTFGTIGPCWQDSDVQTALQTLANSAFGVQGWGAGTHIVGNKSSAAGGVPGADTQTIEGYFDTLATEYDFTFGIVSARDASPAAKWSGTAETEATWINSINADFSTVSAKRMVVGAGNWNMPSAFQNASAGTPRYRRNVAWALAARTAQLPPQRHHGRVKDGSLAQIVVDPINDQKDGFVYHDEAAVPGLDFKTSGVGGRFSTTRRRKGRGGVFISQPLTMAPFGSDFWMVPFRRVMDVACSLVHELGDVYINDEVPLNANGTIVDQYAATIEAAIAGDMNDQMFSQKMISQRVSVAIDRTANIANTGNVPITIQITGDGYILAETVTIGFANSNTAAA